MSTKQRVTQHRLRRRRNTHNQRRMFIKWMIDINFSSHFRRRTIGVVAGSRERRTIYLFLSTPHHVRLLLGVNIVGGGHDDVLRTIDFFYALGDYKVFIACRLSSGTLYFGRTQFTRPLPR